MNTLVSDLKIPGSQEKKSMCYNTEIKSDRTPFQICLLAYYKTYFWVHIRLSLKEFDFVAVTMLHKSAVVLFSALN